MKRLPDISIRLGALHEIMDCRVKIQMLLTSIELGIFDSLSSQKSREEIANELETNTANTGFLLDGLTAVGLLEKEKGLYRNTTETEAALNRKSPAYIGEMLVMMDQMNEDVITQMTQRVQFGPPPVSSNFGAEEIWVRYARSMANYQRGGIAQKMAGIVSKIKGFTSFKKMLDLGGGPGLYCIAMVGEHPTMRGVIFDQPAVVKVSEEFIAQYRMQDRITVMGGDYTADSIGEGYDLIWASATLNFVRHDLASMLKKIFDALAPGGVFISLAEGATHERTQPVPFVLGNLAFTLSGQDMMFNKGEIAVAMHESGFSTVENRTVETPMLSMELDIARK